MSATLENSAVATELEKSVSVSIAKKDNDKEYSNYHTIVLISHVSKVVLKILHVKIQRYTIGQLPAV